MRDFELANYRNYPDDTYLSTVRTLQNQDGTYSLYKASRFMLSEQTYAMAEFLEHLQDNPHPNLLAPDDFNAEIGQPLVEIYPYVGRPLLNREQHTIRKGLHEEQLDVGDILDVMLQLTDAVSYINQLGFVHRDVKDTNAFVGIRENRLRVMVFDYNCLTRPFFQKEPVDIWNSESPPELRDGNTQVDARFDVYGLGCILFDLTHDRYDSSQPIGTLDPNHPIFDVMNKAKTTLANCYPDAKQMYDDLLLAAE